MEDVRITSPIFATRISSGSNRCCGTGYPTLTVCVFFGGADSVADGESDAVFEGDFVADVALDASSSEFAEDCPFTCTAAIASSEKIPHFRNMVEWRFC